MSSQWLRAGYRLLEGSACCAARLSLSCCVLSSSSFVDASTATFEIARTSVLVEPVSELHVKECHQCGDDSQDHSRTRVLSSESSRSASALKATEGHVLLMVSVLAAHACGPHALQAKFPMCFSRNLRCADQPREARGIMVGKLIVA